MVFAPLIISWIVNIAAYTMLCSIKGLDIPICIKFFPFNQSFGQIWVWNVKTSKTDHVSISTLDLGNSCFWVKLLIGNYNALEMGTKGFRNIGYLLLRCFKVLLLTEVDFIWLPNLNEPNRSFTELLTKVAVGLNWVHIIHIVNSGDWRYFNANLPGFKELQNYIN